MTPKKLNHKGNASHKTVSLCQYHHALIHKYITHEEIAKLDRNGQVLAIMEIENKIIDQSFQKFSE